MRDLLARLRADLTPQAVAMIALAMLLIGGGSLLAMRGETAQMPLEKRVSRALSGVSGAGRVDVVIQTKKTAAGAFAAAQQEETPVGAVAVAQGADDPIVNLELQQALCALLGLPPSAVSVVTGGS